MKLSSRTWLAQLLLGMAAIEIDLPTIVAAEPTRSELARYDAFCTGQVRGKGLEAGSSR
jgi:hypothetical protein